MRRPTPRIELVWASPEDSEAVLSVAGVSVTLTADELADLIAEAAAAITEQQRRGT